MKTHNVKFGNVNIENFTQRTISVLGGKGAGKSETLKLLAFHSPVPVLIIDPIGVMNMPKANRIIITKKENDQGEKCARILLKYKSKLTILSFQNMLNDEIVEFMDAFIPAFPVEDYLVIIDEIQNLTGQNPRGTGYSMELQRWIKHGRNKNIGFAMASQRAASVNKEVLALTDYLVLLRTTWSNDLKVIKELISNVADEETMKTVMTSIQTKGFMEGFTINFIPSVGEEKNESLLKV